MLTTSVEARRLIWSDRHARERAAERYGLELSSGDIEEMERQVRESDPRAVVLANLPRSSYLVAFHLGGWVPFVYSTTREHIVTASVPRKLDPYRSFLDELDPATGLPVDDEEEEPDESCRVLYRPDGEVPPEVARWQAEQAARRARVPIDELDLAGLFARQEELSARVAGLLAERRDGPASPAWQRANGWAIARTNLELSDVNARIKVLRAVPPPAPPRPAPDPMEGLPPFPPGKRGEWLAGTEGVAATAGVADPTDLACLATACHEAMRAMGARHGYDWTEREQAVINLLSRLMHADRKYAYTAWRRGRDHE
jgi:hypothetical protein